MRFVRNLIGKRRMANTNNDIEEPVKKSWKVLFFGILILLLLFGLGVFLLMEAFQEPKDSNDALDMKRMMISGIGVLLFSLAVVVFLWSLYKPLGKSRKSVKKASVKKNYSRTNSPMKSVVKKRTKKRSR